MNGYYEWCNDVGISPETLRKLAQIDTDIVDTPVNVEIKKSEIDGNGVFALSNHLPGETICLSRFNGRTIAGRYINHSDSPNSGITGNMAIQKIIALRNIESGEELTIDYRQPGVIDVGAIKKLLHKG